MPKSCLPFLMFQENAEDAIEFYSTAIPGFAVSERETYGDGEALSKGALKTARLDIAGQAVMCFNSPTMHDFTFTPSFSLYLECEDEDEVRSLAGKLSQGGAELMPVGNYGFSKLYAWVNDRFGVSWQINCS
jgi:predicted 3-demethylubiquinone-9 3-methyltransferase (glyoxalase superfamily)